MWNEDQGAGGIRQSAEALPPDHFYHPLTRKLRAYRTPWDLPLARLVKGTLGKLLMRLMPGYSGRIRAAPFHGRLSLAGRLIRNGHLVRAVEGRDHQMITAFLRNYWSSKMSDEFYTGLSHRYETLFLAYHADIVGETRLAMSRCGDAFSQVVEIGSGDGKILEHFSRELECIDAFHGIDVNLPQVENNNMRFRGRQPSLAFHHAEAGRWLLQHATPGTVVLANGGVLEYFTRSEVEGLFAFLATVCAPCVISLTESIAADHDLENERATYPYGYELSLSHNYIALLNEAGFRIHYVNDRLSNLEESETIGRWLQVVACKAAAGGCCD